MPSSSSSRRYRCPHFARPLILFVAVCCLFGEPVPASAQTWKFKDVTVNANVRYTHGYNQATQRIRRAIVSGVAAGDYDNDGYIDLYIITGDVGSNVLARNKGDNSFEDVTVAAGVAVPQEACSGPLFADFNGDGWLDLFIGGIEETTPKLFLNKGDGTFEDVTLLSGIDTQEETYSAAAADYDKDGDLDLLLAHWWGDPRFCSRLWRNRGDATFECVDDDTGLDVVRNPLSKFGFAPNFADIDNDGWLDILLASDFETSQVFRNKGDGTFADITDPAVITDQNGMGAAVGDYDNDGDLDWFVSSIWDLDPPPEVPYDALTGNRMYENQGDGTFIDATDKTGVRLGGWGWGASFADFNNDGLLDLYHVNGFPYDDPEFFRDIAPLYIANGDGSFTDRSVELGAAHQGQGRGVVCFDYDRDGDLDILVSSANAPVVMYRNNGGNNQNYLTVKLRGMPGNTEAIGARLYATVGEVTQMRELRAGNNYVSQNPVEAHFGLDAASTVDELRVVWPDGRTTELEAVAGEPTAHARVPRGGRAADPAGG